MPAARQQCLARTGRPYDEPCPANESGAHCCKHPDMHPGGSYVHTCACGYQWTSLTGSVGDLIDRLEGPWRQRR